MTQFVVQLRNQVKWYARPGHNARDLMGSHPPRNAADEIERLTAKLEMGEKDIALKEKVIDSLGTVLNAAANERDALRTELAVLRSSMTFRTSLIGRIEAERDALQAKVDAMERQEPVAWLHETRPDSGVVTDTVKRVWEASVAGSLAAYSIPLYLAPGAQPAPSFADAYQGAMEEVAIWKKRALEAEDLNRKFVAEINGHAYMGEPAQPAPSVPDLLESLRCACNYIDKLGGVSQQYRAMLAAAPEAKS